MLSFLAAALLGGLFGLIFRVADLVVVEIAQELGRAALFHHTLEPAPGGLGALRGAPPLRLDVAHEVIDVKIVALDGVLRVLFLELVRFGLLTHAANALRSVRGSTTRGL